MTKCYIAMQFFGLFRTSELLGDLKLKIPPLLFSNFKINDNLLTTELTQYKHSNGKGAVVKLCKQPSPSICPINLLSNYITLRGSRPGPLFILGNGKPLGKQAFAIRLRRCCVAAGLPPRTFSHSLRIGAATLAAQMGKSPAEIMALGRWSSTAYLHYIRTLEPLKAPQSLSLRLPEASSCQRTLRPSASTQDPTTR